MQRTWSSVSEKRSYKDVQRNESVQNVGLILMKKQNKMFQVRTFPLNDNIEVRGHNHATIWSQDGMPAKRMTRRCKHIYLQPASLQWDPNRFFGT